MHRSMGALVATIAAIPFATNTPAHAEPKAKPLATCIIFCKPGPVAAIQPDTKSPQVRLTNNSFVYVYNFLDLRDEDFGEKVVAEVDRQIAESLAQHGIKAKAMRSKGTPFAAKPVPGGYWSSGYAGNSNTSYVPVGEIVGSNAADEQASGATHRLIIFPSNMTLSGAWKFYEVRWVLFDVSADVPAWEHVYSGKHLTLWKTDENSVARGAKLVGDATSAMQKSGIF
jgi:hypothetical protein